MSAPSLVQDNGAPAWLSTAARDPCVIASLAALAVSDGSTSRTISCVRDAFRRLLLQIGGASIAGAGRARQAPSSDCVLSDPRT
jgi:hypothetical protein